MTLTEIKEVAKRFEEIRNTEHYTYGAHYPRDVLDACEQLEVLGREWGDPLPSGDFRMYKGTSYHICNSATHYIPGKDQWTIHWDNGNVGRLQFVGNKYYNTVAHEWDEFLRRMREGCVDYDPLNCHIVYDIENGKKIMEEYDDICKETKIAMSKVIKKKQLQEAEKELERLREEIDGES